MKTGKAVGSFRSLNTRSTPVQDLKWWSALTACEHLQDNIEFLQNISWCWRKLALSIRKKISGTTYRPLNWIILNCFSALSVIKNTSQIMNLKLFINQIQPPLIFHSLKTYFIYFVKRNQVTKSLFWSLQVMNLKNLALSDVVTTYNFNTCTKKNSYIY